MHAHIYMYLYMYMPVSIWQNRYTPRCSIAGKISMCEV